MGFELAWLDVARLRTRRPRLGGGVCNVRDICMFLGVFGAFRSFLEWLLTGASGVVLAGLPLHMRGLGSMSVFPEGVLAQASLLGQVA